MIFVCVFLCFLRFFQGGCRIFSGFAKVTVLLGFLVSFVLFLRPESKACHGMMCYVLKASDCSESKVHVRFDQEEAGGEGPGDVLDGCRAKT